MPSLIGTARDYGSRLSPGRRGLIQIDIEFVSPVAADQRQFERGTLGGCAWRQSVELEAEALRPGRAVFEQCRNRQRPVRCGPFDEQADLPGVRCRHVDKNRRFAVTLDVAAGQWV